MSRARQPSAFRQSDVTKTLKAVIAAGLRVVGVKVGDGKIEVVTGEAPVEDSTPLDTWMTKHGPHQT
jgi:hypothetical protein